MAKRKQYPLRVDPALWEAVERWAADDLRSVNAQVEFILRRALKDAGRLKPPGGADGGEARPDGKGRALALQKTGRPWAPCSLADGGWCAYASTASRSSLACFSTS